MALLFLFLLLATVVAALVIVNLDGSQAHDFEHVVSDRVQDQINGIRDLIDQATGGSARRWRGSQCRPRVPLRGPPRLAASGRFIAAGCGMPSSASAVGRDVGQDAAVGQLHAVAP